jgi:hypothetical protein
MRHIENNIKSTNLKYNELYIVYEEGHYYPVGVFKDLNSFVNCFIQRLEKLEESSLIVIDNVIDNNGELIKINTGVDGDYQFYYEVIDIDTYYYRGIDGSGLPKWYHGGKSFSVR